MKNLILIYLLLFTACKSSQNIANDSVPSAEDQGFRITTALPTPGSFLTIGHGLTISQTKQFRPFSRTVQDEATGTTLNLQVDESGFIEADCYTEPDTVLIPQVITYPKPIPCPTPEKPKSPIKNYLFFLTVGFFLGRYSLGQKLKKLYDRFKTFIRGIRKR